MPKDTLISLDICTQFPMLLWLSLGSCRCASWMPLHLFQW